MEAIFSIKKKMPTFSNETFHEFRKEAINQVISSLPSCQTWAKGAGATGAEL
jgi:hypothetical protein